MMGKESLLSTWVIFPKGFRRLHHCYDDLIMSSAASCRTKKISKGLNVISECSVSFISFILSLDLLLPFFCSSYSVQLSFCVPLLYNHTSTYLTFVSPTCRFWRARLTNLFLFPDTSVTVQSNAWGVVGAREGASTNEVGEVMCWDRRTSLQWWEDCSSPPLLLCQWR